MGLKNIIIGLGLFSSTYATSLWSQTAQPTDSLTPSTFEQILLDTERAYTVDAETYLKHLSRKESNASSNRLLSALVHLHKLDLDEAESELKSLDKLRNISTEDQAQISRIEKQISQARRMLTNVSMIPIIANDTKKADDTMAELSHQTQHIGIFAQDHYESADHTVQWRVIREDKTNPTFGIIHMLNSGEWDIDGIDYVEVPGLHPEGTIKYPALMPDGQTLYFAYSGPETLGGYDIYVTRYDQVSKSLLIPQQLPMPLNTTANDYLYIIDNERKVGYLITEHNTRNGDMRMIILANDKQEKVNTDDPKDITRIALRDSIQQSATLLRPIIEQKISNEDKNVAPTLLRIGKREIRSLKDLNSQDARGTMKRLISLQGQLKQLDKELNQLRKRIGETRETANISKKILEMEEKRLSIAREIRSLENEVIRLETRMK